MSHCISLLFFTLVFHLSLASQTVLSPRIASYDIDVTLEEVEKKLFADQTIYWKNISENPVSELQFHLYYNAFKNSESTFYNGSGGISFANDANDCRWGWTNVLSLVDENGNELIERMEFIQPDDDNNKDQTVIRIPLEQAVEAGATVNFKMKWEAQIPNIAPRTGYNKDYHFMVQWFPKLGVYEPKGMRYATEDQWNCHQYHSSGEYYADFGNYNVKINVPKNYELGASGVLIEKTEVDDRNIWHFQANDVIDFAWTASPQFVVLKDKWRDVDLKLYCYPDHAHFAGRYFSTLKNAFEYLDENVGTYPYPSLSIVDPPIHGLFTGGMEYPMLISSLSFCFFPSGIKTPETLVVHEFVHQYFMQMIASHEQEEPWMDEGITTYYEGRILDHFYGSYESTIDVLGVKVGNAEFNRAEFLASENPKIADNTYKSRDYIHGGYGTIAYNKTAMWLKTLEGLVGLETQDAIFKRYFERWKFKHPCASDFEDVVNEVVLERHGTEFGENMTWFFDQVLRGSEACDYKLAAIYNNTKDKPTGFLENTEDCVLQSNEDVESEDRPYYESTVVIHRLGEVKLPIEVQVNFDDGTSVVEKWDGIRRSTEFNYKGTKKIISAEIDPERKIDLDSDFINNSLCVNACNTGIKKYFTKAILGIQHLMENLCFFI